MSKTSSPTSKVADGDTVGDRYASRFDLATLPGLSDALCALLEDHLRGEVSAEQVKTCIELVREGRLVLADLAKNGAALGYRPEQEAPAAAPRAGQPPVSPGPFQIPMGKGKLVGH